MNGWEVLGDSRYELAEGARWHQSRLLFTDLHAGVLYGGAERPRRLLSLEMPLGAVAPVEGGGWIIAAGTGIAVVRDGAPRWLADVGRPGVRIRMNDAVCDPSGRFWAGSMADDGAVGEGSLYRVDPDGSVHRALDGLGVPNGPAFTACGTRMYLADSAQRTVRCFEVDPCTGALGRSRVFARWRTSEGRPDGLAVDDEAHLWVAVWGAGELHRYSPRGVLVRRVRTPTLQPTSVAFGDGHLYATTARYRMDEPDPVAGAILRRRCAVGATPAEVCSLSV
ncbi:SMP-30/gluconolactonase/LRE family protein [Amycolatopsis sp. La24]|uniref:SMP-30/gluconolactonase/LRE family protein n=1 Tax=Amycolatopsis sp. La24 TaxID=3028304 RepID=UPI0023B0874A|nr:SMP-30/gluconolactonase/LRE family protein [Amycolatopsis sp. La24]